MSMKRICCQVARICTPCCLPKHDLKIDFTVELTHRFLPDIPPPWLYDLSLPLVYSPISNAYSAVVPHDYAWFQNYALGVPIPPGSYDPSSGTGWPPSEHFFVDCESDTITVYVVLTAGPFSIPGGGGGFWTQPKSGALITENVTTFIGDTPTSADPGSVCSCTFSCDPINISCGDRDSGCVWGRWNFSASILMRKFTITDPNWDGSCETPSGVSMNIPIVACLNDLSGANITITRPESEGDYSGTGTSISNGLVSFDFPWRVFDVSWTQDPGTPIFRNTPWPEGTGNLFLDANVPFPNTSFDYRVRSDCVCIHSPLKIPVKETLYLTDPILGSAVLSSISGTQTWRGTSTFTLESPYTRPDGVTCPPRDFGVIYDFIGDQGQGVLKIWIWADINYCPQTQPPAVRLTTSLVECVADLSMIDSDIIMFRANAKWTNPPGQPYFSDIFTYVYGEDPIEFLISE